MKESNYDFERKYEVQDDLLNYGSLEGLDSRTLHETIKAMLVNTTKDCIKYENYMDPDMTEIMKILYSVGDKTEDDIKKLKNSQEKLKNSLHCAKISENSLFNLILEMLLSDEIKHVFKQDIPAMFESTYYLIDIEEEIAESVTYLLSELYEAPSYKEICLMINNTIEEFVENAEEYIEDLKEKELYDEFIKVREEGRKKKTEQEGANE